MKTEMSVTYEKQDVIELVLKEHTTKFTAPPGMVWDAELNYRDEVVITAVPEKEIVNERV